MFVHLHRIIYDPLPSVFFCLKSTITQREDKKIAIIQYVNISNRKR